MSKNNKITLLRKPFVRTGLILIFLTAIIISGIFAYDYVSKVLFYENPHFTLKNVVVRSTGYWNNRVNEVIKILSLKKGSTNLFSVNLNNLREKLETMAGEGISYVEVTREFPDTLKFTIVERIPRALLYNRSSDMLVDNDAILINSKYYKNIIDGLPIITGFKLPQIKGREIPYGETIACLKPALIFISIVETDYSDMEVKTVNLYLPNKLIVFMLGPEEKLIKVIFPFEYSAETPPTQAQLTLKIKILRKKLDELKELLRYLKWKNANFSEINMLYKGQAIVR